MEKARNAIEAQLPGGPHVVLAEMTCAEVINAIKGAGKDANPLVVRVECVRHALRQVDGREVRYVDVAGKLLHGCLPRFRHRTQAGLVWARLHDPTAEEIEAVKATVKVSEDGDGETWTATLPDGRSVTLAEPAEETVGDILRRVGSEVRSELAQQLVGAIDSLRDSVRAVDGRAVTGAELAGAGWDRLFSVKETILLSMVWQEMQMGSARELGELGELPLAGGTP